VIYCTCLVKTNKVYFSFLIAPVICPLHVSNTVTINHQQAVTVHVAYGIYDFKLSPCCECCVFSSG
jgi:hypothetical protein